MADRNGATQPHSGLGALLQVHGMSAAAADLRRRNASRLGCLPAGGILLLCIGLVSALGEKEDPANPAMRTQLLMLMAALLAGCVALLAVIAYLYSKAKQAAARSNIAVYEHGIVLTRGKRWGEPMTEVCPWREIADLRRRNMGPALLGLELTRSDGSTVFLASSFDDVLKIEERFNASRGAG